MSALAFNDRPQPPQELSVIPDDSISLDEQDIAESNPTWLLKKLSGKHKNICSLIAQGTSREVVARACDVTPTYVSMLLRQPLCRSYILRLNEACDVQLEAMFGAAVEAISDAMQLGTPDEKIKAARLQMEATGRIGPKGAIPQNQPSEDRLVRLSERLVGLLEAANGRVINGTAFEVGDGNILRSGHDGSGTPETDSDGQSSSTGQVPGEQLPEEVRTDTQRTFDFYSEG